MGSSQCPKSRALSSLPSIWESETRRADSPGNWRGIMMVKNYSSLPSFNLHVPGMGHAGLKRTDTIYFLMELTS